MGPPTGWARQLASLETDGAAEVAFEAIDFGSDPVKGGGQGTDESPARRDEIVGGSPTVEGKEAAVVVEVLVERAEHESIAFSARIMIGCAGKGRRSPCAPAPGFGILPSDAPVLGPARAGRRQLVYCYCAEGALLEFRWFVCAGCGSRIGHAPSVGTRLLCRRCEPRPDAMRDAIARRLLNEAGVLEDPEA
jgi:hypothetical protein